ncbi:unnamed protein product [Sphagnum tenellum]
MWASSMDEAADWRKKYDDENGKVLEILQRLTDVEQQLQNCTLDRKAVESEKRTLLEAAEMLTYMTYGNWMRNPH